jgi:predicted glycosyl hydrolase (DUF1957 family)
MATKNKVIAGLVSGFLFCGLVAVAVMPHDVLVNMRVDESTAGPLGAGQYREITASYLFDGHRGYRVEVDAGGKRSELYEEEGVRKPVDDKVRSWVAEMSAMHTHTVAPATAG